MNQLLEAALKYAKRGWKIFPCVPREKRPMTTNGVKNATDHPDAIRAWWEKWPDANIAVACGKPSGIYVVDVDVDDEKEIDGYESMKEFGLLPKTITQDTPRGGAHAFFKADNPPANKNSFRPGIDVRSDGYYVLLAPSIHPNGKQYAWLEGYGPEEMELAEYPDCLRPAPRPVPAEFNAGPPTPVPPGFSAHPSTDANDLQRASAYLAKCEAAVQGQAGHDKLFWAASAMVYKIGLSDDQAYDILAREYNPRCIPPWDLSLPKDEKDFRRKITEARKNPPAKLPLDASGVDAAAMLREFREAQPDPATAAASVAAIKEGRTRPIQDVIDEKELQYLIRPTGLLGDICKWIDMTAIRKQPFLTLACSLTFLGVLFGRKVKDRLGSRTNLYCMGVAPSSAGKGHALNQIRNLCYKAGCIDLLGGTDVASDSAIEERISNHPATLFLWDEIGSLLSHIRSGLSAHHTRIVSLLMRLYSSAGGIFLGREYAEKEKQRTIVEPCCCLYGTSTPERFVEGISVEELQDGWLSRCLVFQVTSTPRKTRGCPFLPPPDDVMERVAAWFSRRAGMDDGCDIGTFAVYSQTSGIALEQPPEQLIIPATDEAEKLFVQLDDKAAACGEKAPRMACLWAKAEENARRIALILAAGDNFNSPEVTAGNAEYACRLVCYLLESFIRETVVEIVTCQTDNQKRMLLKIIKEAGINGCLSRQITRAARWSKKRQREELLADLREGGEIVAQATESGKGVRWWTVENYPAYQATP